MSPRMFSRRHLLALPSALLGGAFTRPPSAAYAANPGNLIIFHTPNGFGRSHFGAAGAGTNFSLKPSFLPLQAFKQELNVVTGLCNKATDVHLGASQLCRLLTCARGHDATTAHASSLDQRLAMHIGSAAVNLAVAGTPGSPWQERLSWLDAGRAASNVWDPLAAWQASFGTPLPWQDEVADKELLVLGYLEKDTLRTAPVPFLPIKEQERVRTHQEAWADLKKRWMNRAGSCQPASITQESLAALPTTITPEALAAHGRAKMDLIVTALKCQTRRVFTLLWQPAGPNGLNPISGKRDHFELSQKTDPTSVEARRQIDTWYATEFAYLLDALKRQQLLDQTIVVWCSEVAEGQHHNNMTFVTAGGAALGLAQAQTVALPFSGAESAGLATAKLPQNRAVADLWLTLLKLFGHSAASFGDSEDGSRVIEELMRT